MNEQIGFYVIPRASVNGIHFERRDSVWRITPESSQPIIDESESYLAGLEKVAAIQAQYAPILESQWKDFVFNLVHFRHTEFVADWMLQ